MDLDLPLADELASMYARMSGLLLSQETVATALGVVTSLAVETVPGSTGAGVTLHDRDGRPTSAAATDVVVEQADALQYELELGPCLTAWARRTVVRIDDTALDGRWARWCAGVQPLGLRASLSAPLIAGKEALGAIKVYAAEPWTYDARSEHLLTLFAAQAAILLANVQSLQAARRLSRQLAAALTSRDAVARATGVLLAQGATSPQDAFALLADTARRSDRTVEDVARALLAAVTARTTGSDPT